jgi:ABC-type spermidine/putrescine transport systems, ATPase components
MISGLETPTSGVVHIDGHDVTENPAYERDTSMVFQDWALFPYKTVLENVVFGLRMRGDSRTERTQRAREMLERVHMAAYEDYSPADLSGGQKQRVALARSLAVDPDVLLLDEPLSNLDKRLREEMQIELKNIHGQFDKTFVYVTHNQDEAFTLADRIGIINDGELVQVGEPNEVYQDPTNRFVEEFLGDTNFISGRFKQLNSSRCAISTSLGPTVEVSGDRGIDSQRNLTISLRPEVMQLQPQSQSRGETSIADSVRADGNGKEGQSVNGVVENTIYRGSTIRYIVDTGSEDLFVEQQVTGRSDITQGDDVELIWQSEDMLFFDSEGDRMRVYQ